MLDREIQRIKAIGTFALAIGMIQLLLTGLITLFVLSAAVSTNFSGIVRGAATLGLSLVMSASLLSCGHELQRTRPYSSSVVADIRWIWTALVLIMALSVFGGLILQPVLAGESALVLLALFTIRTSIIKVTRML